MRTLLLIVTAILVLGCNKPDNPPLSLAEVKVLICGNYQGEYNNGKEYFEIKPDGSFSQKFVRAGVTVYELQGTWRFRELEDGYKVTFEPFMDLGEAIWGGKKPEKVLAMIATFYEDEPTIYFFEDIHYYITKQRDIGNTNNVTK